MAVTKTKFINYIRCPRYVALDEIKDAELEADVSLEAYQEEERKDKVAEILNSMTDGKGESIIDIKDEQLITMLPYYQEIESLACKQVQKQFGGNPLPNAENKQQESFDFTEKGVKYLCYVDIYNETETGIAITEVKATTSSKFLKLGPTINKELFSIFAKAETGIYHLKDELTEYQKQGLPPKYYEFKAKLFDKYHACGRYVYDLLVQRMIIEGYFKENKQVDKGKSIKYYLAVLNKDYIFKGEYDEKGFPLYNQDELGNELIVFFDFTKLTKELIPKVLLDKERIYQYLMAMDPQQCPLGPFCEPKKTSKCKFLDICFYNVIPRTNSILNYFYACFGFKDKTGQKHEHYDLINQGLVKMTDLDEFYLHRENNVIQFQSVINNKPYYKKEKIKRGLEHLEYPLYHLDFESFPCPLPRLRGEHCYRQSVFQFSLHIERAPGVCDFNNDHYEFLAPDLKDYREEIAHKLCKYIDPTKGTIIAYYCSFEKQRLLELGTLFPQYQKQLKAMTAITFDLLYLVQNNKKLYQELGFAKADCETINYYHPQLNGSFSIKKVLPALVPSLSYADLIVGNGTEALVTYAKFPQLSKEEYIIKYQALLDYCKQDTWAMVLILEALRKIVK